MIQMEIISTGTGYWYFVNLTIMVIVIVIVRQDIKDDCCQK